MQFDDIVRALAAKLGQTEQRLVLAESCTCGLIAAAMSQVPGISSVLAGSAVVYQIPTKVQWLGVSQQTIDQHDVVSEAVAVEMADHVLQKTPHATVSASITGHLGPDAPADLDGVAWCGIAMRDSNTQAWQLSLRPSPDEVAQRTDLQVRHLRQQDAVRQVLQLILGQLKSAEQAE